MNIDLLDEDRLSHAERALADSVPFGNEIHIAAGVTEVYLGLLAAFADESAGALALSRLLAESPAEVRRAVLRDPLLRRTIEDGFCLHKLGRDAISVEDLDELLAEAARVAARDRGPLLSTSPGLVRIPSDTSESWVWTRLDPAGAAGRRFVDQCLCRTPVGAIDSPDRDQLRDLLDGAQLAHALVPRLARSSLAHVSMIAVATARDGLAFNSMTVLGLPGTVLLSPAVLATPLRAAEALLHEAHHLKFMDLDYCENLFAPGFRPDSSPRVTPPWHRDSDKGDWPIDRLLTAMHVYMALAVFLGRVSRAPELGAAGHPVLPAERALQALDRARYLVGEAREHGDYLSPAGVRFVDWIEATLGALDPRTSSALGGGSRGA